MASPRKPTKQSSGWGGFLQQAVLSVESKLDTILADEDQPPPKSTASSAAQEITGRGNIHSLLPSIETDMLVPQLQQRFLEARRMPEPMTACRSDLQGRWQRRRAKGAMTVHRLLQT